MVSESPFKGPIDMGGLGVSTLPWKRASQLGAGSARCNSWSNPPTISSRPCSKAANSACRPRAAYTLTASRTVVLPDPFLPARRVTRPRREIRRSLIPLNPLMRRSGRCRSVSTGVAVDMGLSTTRLPRTHFRQLWSLHCVCSYRPSTTAHATRLRSLDVGRRSVLYWPTAEPIGSPYSPRPSPQHYDEVLTRQARPARAVLQSQPFLTRGLSETDLLTVLCCPDPAPE